MDGVHSIINPIKQLKQTFDRLLPMYIKAGTLLVDHRLEQATKVLQTSNYSQTPLPLSSKILYSRIQAEQEYHIGLHFIVSNPRRYHNQPIQQRFQLKTLCSQSTLLMIKTRFQTIMQQVALAFHETINFAQSGPGTT